jgi:hypothetical protein
MRVLLLRQMIVIRLRNALTPAQAHTRANVKTMESPHSPGARAWLAHPALTVTLPMWQPRRARARAILSARQLSATRCRLLKARPSSTQTASSTQPQASTQSSVVGRLPRCPALVKKTVLGPLLGSSIDAHALAMRSSSTPALTQTECTLSSRQAKPLWTSACTAI